MSLLVHQLTVHLETAVVVFCLVLLLKENVILILRQIFYRIPILLCQHSYLNYLDLKSLQVYLTRPVFHEIVLPALSDPLMELCISPVLGVKGIQFVAFWKLHKKWMRQQITSAILDLYEASCLMAFLSLHNLSISQCHLILTIVSVKCVDQYCQWVISNLQTSVREFIWCGVLSWRTK